MWNIISQLTTVHIQQTIDFILKPSIKRNYNCVPKTQDNTLKFHNKHLVSNKNKQLTKQHFFFASHHFFSNSLWLFENNLKFFLCFSNNTEIPNKNNNEKKNPRKNSV